MDLYKEDPMEDQNSQQTQQPAENTPNQEQETRQDQPETSKSYTQKQLSAMMAKEKRTARQALLKELGFDTEDDQSYQTTIASIKKTLDAGKTQQQLDQEAKTKAEDEAKEANARAALAEMKISALTAGVNPEHLDDMIILAQAKITNGQEVAQVFADLKQSYPDAFGTGSEGTGSHMNPAHKRGNDGENRGVRLAKQNKPPVKSTYFKH